MRNPRDEFLAALVAAPEKGIKPRKFVWITGKDREFGTPVSIGFWSGDYSVDVPVISGTTGLEVARTYHGSGALLSVSNIPLVNDLTIQTVTVELSQIAVAAQQAVRGLDARFAQVEIHDGLLDPDTDKLTSPPEIVFIGEVDGEPIETPEVGNEGSIRLEIVSAAMRALTRTNPRKRSAEGQRRRQGDEFGRYSNIVKEFKLKWSDSTDSNQQGVPRSSGWGR